MFYANGTIESGIWKDGRLAEEKNIRGCISGDCDNGTGTYIYSNYTRYQGNFRDNVSNGQGTCYYADGDVYMGSWKHHNFDSSVVNSCHSSSKLFNQFVLY